MKLIRDVTFSWTEGRYFDLWMFAHFVTGTLLGCIALLFSIDRLYAYGTILIVLTIWELTEKFFGIHESAENRMLDIVVGIVGCASAYELFFHFSHQSHLALTLYSLVVALLLNLIGWLDYQRRKEEEICK